MRRLNLALVLVLLPLAGAVQLQPVEVTFNVPLLAEADVEAGPWQWLVLFVEPDGQAVANGSAEGFTDVVTTIRESASIDEGDGRNTRAPLREHAEPSTFSPGTIQARSSQGWTSLVLEAESITLEARVASVAVDLQGPNRPIGHFGSRQPHPTALRWENLEDREPGPWMHASPLNGATHVDVQVVATGIHAADWHGWDLSCPGDCGDASTDSTTTPLGTAASLDTHRYVKWSGDVSLTIDASAWLVVAGTSDAVSFDHAGVLRLPAAESSLFNATGDALRLDGEGSLLDLHAAGQGSDRLTGTLQGSYVGLQLGESSLDSSPSVAQAATVAAIVLLPFFLRWLWLLARSDRLSEAQEDLAEALRVAPGSSYRDLLRITGFSNGSLDWHLRSLERRRLVASREYKNTKRLFWGAVPQDWKRIVVTARDDLRPLLDWMEVQPAFTLSDVVEALETSRSTVQGWLADLVDADMVHACKDGRRRIYLTLPHCQETTPAVAVAAE